MLLADTFCRLDGQTLANLEVLENNETRTTEHTLLGLVAQTRTAFGRRLLRRWLCHPLRSRDAIVKRHDAVALLIADANGGATDARAALRKLPDLERMISRIHSGSVKPTVLLEAIQGLREVADLAARAEAFNWAAESVLLKSLVSVAGGFPDMRAQLDAAAASFVEAKARDDGILVPPTGVDAEWDAAEAGVAAVEGELAAHLGALKGELRCPKLQYKNMGKEHYQVEVPKEAWGRVPSDWTSKSSTKAVRRFWTAEVEAALPRLAEANEQRRLVADDLNRRILGAFDANFPLWKSAISCAAQLDVLLALAAFSGDVAAAGRGCRPRILAEGPGRFAAKGLVDPRHVDDYVPNDVDMGGDSAAHTVLLTGTNAGGKSTLLRTVALNVILAQLGAWVTATECEMTVHGRILSRMGARDNIMNGQSTFMVELQEAATILTAADEHSLVVCDELGRGSSTFCGYSIAFAVLRHLAARIRCRVLFSTHFHLLVDDFARDPLVAPMHMASILNEAEQTVTFLYQLCAGPSPNESSGLAVANMAGVPKAVTEAARRYAKEFRQNSQFAEHARRLRAAAVQVSAEERAVVSRLRSLVDSSALSSSQDTMDAYSTVLKIWQAQFG